MLLSVSSLDDESMRTIDRTTRSKFGKEESNNVLVLPVHLLANLGQVGEDGLLVSFFEHLRRGDGVSSSISIELGVLGSKDSEGSREELKAEEEEGKMVERSARRDSKTLDQGPR